MIADFIATFANWAICVLFMITMHELTVSIHMLNNSISVSEGTKRTKVFKITAIVILTLFVVLVISCIA